MKIHILILTFVLFPVLLFSQKYTISGYITDAGNNEKLIGANVFHPNSKSGTITNPYGFYSITLPKGKIELVFSFVGYLPVTEQIDLSANQIININLKPNIELAEIDVIANKIDVGVESSQMSTVVIPIKTIKSIPALLGEVDIIKAIQLLPGVQSGTEGSSGLYVRGGGPDQNLILLDGIPIYNVNHLFGFFSVFNADAINNVQLIKGGFPARYGGRLSSVLDIRLKDGNNEKIHGTGSVGFISAKLALEGPIIKDKMSFFVSARRTYIDVLAAPFIALYNQNEYGEKMKMGYYFYDMTAKLNYKFNDKHRLYLSAFMGNDKAYTNYKYESGNSYSNDEFFLKWGNIVGALRWNYMINNKLFSNTTLSYTKYNFLTEINSEYKDNSDVNKYSFDYISGIEDYSAKIDFDYIPNPSHYIRFGANNTYHTFNPGVNALKITSSNEEDINNTFGNQKVYTNEVYTYIEDDISFGNFKVNTGLHASGFYVKGKFYNNFEPRLSMRYLIKPNWSVKGAFSMMSQYVHLLANSNIGLPTDLWLPVTDSIKPQKSIQYALGSIYSLNKGVEISVEGFYKQMDNLIAYKEGASFLMVNDEWQNKIETGKGWSYGAEFLIRKTTGKTTGWIGYTLSWSDRQFENISSGQVYPYKYDRRHDISVVVAHKISDKIDMGFSWVYGTGYAVTLATERYSSMFWGDIEHYPRRNDFRMPNYHRLDFNINFHKKKKWGKRTWSVGAYNAYNRQNPFFLFYSYEYDNFGNDSEKVLKQASLFPIIPFVSYSFKF
ncbi:MAG: hypothetical protein B6I20_01530 [Bacteroidetes bacterium 4572_117]|nr:MAG: hypothetical protein B6I20_01530 [Bacteroidetes bacterium 4572_117]